MDPNEIKDYPPYNNPDFIRWEEKDFYDKEGHLIKAEFTTIYKEHHGPE